MNETSVLYPIRRGSKILVCINGKEVELDALEAAIIAQRWTEALSGAYVSKVMEIK